MGSVVFWGAVRMGMPLGSCFANLPLPIAIICKCLTYRLWDAGAAPRRRAAEGSQQKQRGNPPLLPPMGRFWWQCSQAQAWTCACLSFRCNILIYRRRAGRGKKKEKQRKQILRNSIKAVASFGKREGLALNVVSVPFF